jgi:general stress protein 26
MLEVVDDAAIRHALWQENWTMYYPGGVDDPENTVLRLVPQMLRGWAKKERFEMNLQELS